MAQTNIAALWTPDIWIQGTREKMRLYPSLLSSGVVINTPLFDSIASGAGISANIPFYKDVTTTLYTVQAETTAPALTALASGKQVCPILNREVGFSASGLAAQVSGASPDPLGETLYQIGAMRQMGCQRTLIAILQGAFGGGSAANNAIAQLSGVRVEAFAETGLSAGVDQKMSPDLFIVSTALLGELRDALGAGAILTHPNVLAQLLILDRLSFKQVAPGVESGLPFTINTYRGIPIFTSSLLVRAGTTNGYVYETYILGKGTVGMGMKPQSASVGDPSSLQIDLTQIAKNDVNVYDRVRFLLHVNGMKWTGTASGQSATDAELATASNWSLQYQSADRVGGVLIRTNG